MSTAQCTHSRIQSARPLALIAIGFISMVLTACATDGADPTTSLPAPAADPEPIAADPIDALAVVTSSIEAWNSGDFEAWQAHYLPSEVGALDMSEMIARSSIVLEAGECATTARADATIVECPATVTDDFHSAGGLSGAGVMAFTVNDAGVITERSDTFYEDENGRCCPAWQAYNQRFFRWLERVHPDVYDEIGPADGRPQYFLPGVASDNPEHMRVALQYVGDFVAQSEAYPLGQAAPDAAPSVEPLGRGAFVSAVSGELVTEIDDLVISGGPLDDASDVVFAKITIPAGAAAPWHTHTGPAVLVNVGPGTLTSVITTECLAQEIVPGSAFLDPGNGIPHTAVNTGDEDVVLYAVFLAVVENPVTAATEPDVCEVSAG